MPQRLYCPICGKRIVHITNKETYEHKGVSYTAIWYFSDTSAAEPVCFGHDEPPQVQVPQAFYDAFSDKDVQP